MLSARAEFTVKCTPETGGGKYRCACLFSLFDLNNRPGTVVPRVATTWRDCNSNHLILRQNTTHTLLRKLCISRIHYDRQYPQVDTSKAITPCPATSWVYSDYQTRRDYQSGGSLPRTSKSISLLYAKTLSTNLGLWRTWSHDDEWGWDMAPVPSHPHSLHWGLSRAGTGNVHIQQTLSKVYVTS